MPSLVQLTVADPPAVWSDLGFAVHDGVCTISAVDHALGGSGSGLTAWLLAGVQAGADVDGLPTSVTRTGPTDRAEGSDPPHPNGVVAIDHVVVSTPDLDRTVATLDGIGLELRRRRDAGRLRQAFYKLDDVILEVIGPAAAGDGPAQFFGLAFTCADLDVTAGYLGERLRPAKDAVQTGRRIATLDRAAGSSVAMAFMSP